MVNNLESVVLIKILGFKHWTPLANTTKFNFEVLDDDIEALLLHEFTVWILDLLQKKAQVAIDTQKFPVRYPPLSKAYVKRKQKEGKRPGFWRATEFLRRSIVYWWDEKEQAYYIGIPKGVLHPESKQPMTTILLSLELGAPKRNIPPRPLFTILARTMSKNIPRLFEKYLLEYRPEYYKMLVE